jgi:hypothetical protein
MRTAAASSGRTSSTVAPPDRRRSSNSSRDQPFWPAYLTAERIAKARIYDHRKTRPEDSPTFKVAY